MLEQQLESSLDQCKNLQGDLQSKVENELQFNETVASLERQCLEQEEVTKILREEKEILQEAADDLKAETKAFVEQVDALNAQKEEQTEMLMKKSEQNQALEVQILSQTSEI